MPPAVAIIVLGGGTQGEDIIGDGGGRKLASKTHSSKKIEDCLTQQDRSVTSVISANLVGDRLRKKKGFQVQIAGETIIALHFGEQRWFYRRRYEELSAVRGVHFHRRWALSAGARTHVGAFRVRW